MVLGFLASIRAFDLDHFAPHAPGYPVYVALLRMASWLTPSSVAAANAVAVLSAVLALGSLATAARAVPGPGRVSLRSPSPPRRPPLVWRCSSAIGSEAPAFACASHSRSGASHVATLEGQA